MAAVQHVRARLAVRPRADLPARRVGVLRHTPFLPGHPPGTRPGVRPPVVRSAHGRIAGVACLVPSVPAQALLLILNTARSGRLTARPRCRMATMRPRASRRRSRRSSTTSTHTVGVRSGGRVASSDTGANATTASGRWSRQGARYGGVVGAGHALRPRFAQAVRIVARAPLVNVEHLAIRLGRRPTRREIVAEFLARPARALGDGWRALSAGGPPDDPTPARRRGGGDRHRRRGVRRPAARGPDRRARRGRSSDLGGGDQRSAIDDRRNGWRGADRCDRGYRRRRGGGVRRGAARAWPARAEPA